MMTKEQFVARLGPVRPLGAPNRRWGECRVPCRDYPDCGPMFAGRFWTSGYFLPGEDPFADDLLWDEIAWDVDRSRALAERLRDYVLSSDTDSPYFPCFFHLPEGEDFATAFKVALGWQVAPVYLPLATDDSGVLAVHLWPGRAVEASPIVYVGEDQCDVHYLCDDLTNLPTALWLWMGRYLKKRLPDLQEAVDEMAARIPGGRPVPDALWPLLEAAPDNEPTWWYADGAATTQQAWRLAGVGHPFVGVPDPGRRAKPAEALDLLAPFVAAHREPELVSLLIAAQIKAGLDVTYDDMAFVLGAEAWRQSGSLLGGRWRVRGEGLCAWDVVLRHLPDRSILADTPFTELMDHPAAYSGEDREGPLALGRVALAFHEAGDAAAALRQARNALQVAVLALGRYPWDLA